MLKKMVNTVQATTAHMLRNACFNQPARLWGECQVLSLMFRFKINITTMLRKQSQHCSILEKQRYRDIAALDFIQMPHQPTKHLPGVLLHHSAAYWSITAQGHDWQIGKGRCVKPGQAVVSLEQNKHIDVVKETMECRGWPDWHT